MLPSISFVESVDILLFLRFLQSSTKSYDFKTMKEIVNKYVASTINKSLIERNQVVTSHVRLIKAVIVRNS